MKSYFHARIQRLIRNISDHHHYQSCVSSDNICNSQFKLWSFNHWQISALLVKSKLVVFSRAQQRGRSFRTPRIRRFRWGLAISNAFLSAFCRANQRISARPAESSRECRTHRRISERYRSNLQKPENDIILIIIQVSLLFSCVLAVWFLRWQCWLQTASFSFEQQ